MMKVTMYWYPKCGTCRNAKRWLEENGHEVDAIHIVEQTPDQKTLQDLVKKSGLDIKKWFNVSGNVYKTLKLKDKLPSMSEQEKLELLASDGMLIKRPVVTDGEKVTVGFKEDEYAATWGKAL